MSTRSLPRSSIDDIIDLYKRDVDVTLIDAALQRTVEERIRALEEFERFREELRDATERRRDAVR
jgi:predicted Holliday junction resolvase-like endonuclease